MTSHPKGGEGVTKFVTNCDKGEGGVSSFVTSHESYWYACYTQSYQKGKVWRPICFYSIYNSFLLQSMNKFLSILLMG